ncbi:MAG: hypothetical protein IAE84_06755 [Saprospiraceae bacterium]|nr:hypothetical protein [Saprospiraceae bacterium]HRD83121.1 hypothetical protein [Saprospiraceae bacterium]HRF38373.1 hypothetical protein [Saprospiraceae bacterium]HRK81711.1 hypothetical protein [Saprospiraceae bacterium]
MKRMILPALFLLMVAGASAQTELPFWLTDRKWSLKEDVMSGMGTHQSLPKHTQLEFFTNGQWAADEPIAGIREGIWKQGKNGKIMMRFSGKKEAVVQPVKDNEIEIILKVKMKKLIWTWAG